MTSDCFLSSLLPLIAILMLLLLASMVPEAEAAPTPQSGADTSSPICQPSQP